MYISIDRKTENGCELQNICCGRSGVMLKLKLVKSGKEEESTVVNEEGLLHGVVVLKDLVADYAHTNRVICGDSYFASVQACEELRRIGLRFIGVVKNSTTRFPMQYLGEKELIERGDIYGLVSKDEETGETDMMAFVWMDRERRYFVSSTSSLQMGAPYERKRWRQVDMSPNAEPEQVDLQINQPKACETYYSVCGKVDHHNRHRQDSLCVERKLVTDDWSKRVNLSILSMIIVDTWLIYKY